MITTLQVRIEVVSLFKAIIVSCIGYYMTTVYTTYISYVG